MRAAVIGGGLGGCAAAIGLRAVGVDVTVFESADRMRREGESISLHPNGTAALAALGVPNPPGQRIEKITMLNRRSGKALLTIDMAEVERRTGRPYVVIPREDMLGVLIDRLDDGVVYSKRCVAVSHTGSGATAEFADGTTASADLVVGADGSRSVIRSLVWPEDTSKPFSTAWQATVPLPADHPSPTEALLSFAPGTITGIFPTTKDRLLWFIEDRRLRSTGDSSEDKLALLERFGSWGGALPAAIDAAQGQTIRIDQVYVRRPPKQWGRGAVTLAGDAAHALSPSIGQGTNQAFCDAVALAVAVRHAPSTKDALDRYRRSRHRRASAYWWWARLTMAPAAGPSIGLNQRMATDAVATRYWSKATGPDPVVRRVTDLGGLTNLAK